MNKESIKQIGFSNSIKVPMKSCSLLLHMCKINKGEVTSTLIDNHRRPMMPDFYANFQELLLHEQEGEDYRINASRHWHQILIIAPHGGKIESYTSQITQWIAAEDFAWYFFEGLKDLDNRRLHITSHNFDEPTVLQALQEAHTVLTIHGLKNSIDEFLQLP